MRQVIKTKNSPLISFSAIFPSIDALSTEADDPSRMMVENTKRLASAFIDRCTNRMIPKRLFRVDWLFDCLQLITVNQFLICKMNRCIHQWIEMMIFNLKVCLPLGDRWWDSLHLGTGNVNLGDHRLPTIHLGMTVLPNDWVAFCVSDKNQSQANTYNSVW